MKGKVKAIFNLALPYVITVLLPIISIFCLSNIIIGSYNKQVVADKQKSIEAAFDRYLQKIDALENLSYVIAQSDVMTNYIYTGFQKIGRDAVECMEIKELMNDLLINSDVTTMYFYDINDNRLITDDAAYSNPAYFFKYRYKMEGYTPQECVERLKNSSWGHGYSLGIKVEYDGDAKEVMEYRISVPVNIFSEHQSQLVLVMEFEDIFSDFYELLEDGYEFYVYNFEDQLVMGSGERFKDVLDISKATGLISAGKESERIYGMVCCSSDNLWKVKVYMPDLLKVDSSANAMLRIWLLAVLPVVASSVLCIYFTYKNHKEIMEILNLFRKQNTTVPDEKYLHSEAADYKAIRDYANHIINENNRYREYITEYEYSRKYEILDKLVRDTYKNREELEKAFDEIDLQIRHDNCTIICVRFDDSSYRDYITDNVTVKDFVKELFINNIERNFEIFDTSAKETICLLPIDEEENAEVIMRDIVSRLNVEITYYYDIKITIGVGNVVKSIYEVSKSYLQAKDVIRYSEATGNKIFLYSELEKLKDVYYYPKQTDEKIYNYVVVGRAEEAKQIIQNIYRENFENDSVLLSVSASDKVKNKLLESVACIAEKYDISIENTVLSLKDATSIRSYFDILLGLIDVLTKEIEDKRRGTQKYSVVKIMHYINEHFCDSELSMKQISSDLGFHEKYISNLFKTAYGETLSDFIERLRIQKACELLKDSSTRIADISDQVGYTSDVSFRRAFKKITGVSPSEYREKNLKGRKE